jgi:arylsulfatase A-like enzyme
VEVFQVKSKRSFVRVHLLGTTRRSLVLAAAAFLACGAAFERSSTPATAAHAGQDTSQAPTRPNIVVIMTDDQTLESMPVLQKTNALIGRHGVTFDNSIVTFSLCCPSRSTFLTGQYTHNHGVWWNTPPEGGFTKLDHSNTLATWLTAAGYHTVLIGKYLNGYGHTAETTVIPPGWSEWYGELDRSPDIYYDYKMDENGTLVSYGSDPASYSTDVYAAKADAAIRRLASSSQPFFLWLAFMAPHNGLPQEPDDPPDFGTPARSVRYTGAFSSLPFPRPASFNEADVSDKPQTVRGMQPLTAQQIAAITAHYRQSREALLSVDDGVERVVNALTATGALSNTIIVFTSDNGFMHGEHRIPTEKLWHYEPSIRVPLMIRGPGVREGAHVTSLVGNIDLPPTIVQATQATPRRTMDGRSLWPLLSQSPSARWRKALLVERMRLITHPWEFVAVRTTRYTYAEYPFTGQRELYDLGRDPDELTNIANDPAQARLVERLARKLHALQRCTGASCG